MALREFQHGIWEGKYVLFSYHSQSKSGKTSIWHVSNRFDQSFLGLIQWYAPWRQYCFYPYGNIVLAGSCLKDIDEFCQGPTGPFSGQEGS